MTGMPAKDDIQIVKSIVVSPPMHRDYTPIGDKCGESCRFLRLYKVIHKN